MCRPSWEKDPWTSGAISPAGRTPGQTGASCSGSRASRCTTRSWASPGHDRGRRVRNRLQLVAGGLVYVHAAGDGASLGSSRRHDSAHRRYLRSRPPGHHGDHRHRDLLPDAGLRDSCAAQHASRVPRSEPSAYGASRAKTLWRIQIPSALPSLFASLRIAAPLSLVGALLAEWLATGQGLGWSMIESADLSDYSGLWTRVVLITAYSAILYKVIGAVEAHVLRRFGATGT